MLCCAEEAKLGGKRESSYRKLIRSHEGGFNKPFKNKITCDDERVETTKSTRPTKLSNLISTFYRLWPRWSVNCVHASDGEWYIPQREPQKACLAKEKQFTFQREVVETLDNILKEATQVCLAREIPTRQDTIHLNQVVYLQSTLCQQDSKSHNLEHPTGEIHFQIPVRSQLYCF